MSRLLPRLPFPRRPFGHLLLGLLPGALLLALLIVSVAPAAGCAAPVCAQAAQADGYAGAQTSPSLPKSSPLEPLPPAAFVPIAFGHPLTMTVAGWNVDSGGAAPRLIAASLAAFAGVDLWGLAEVESERDAQRFVEAAAEGEGSPFAGILGRSGGTDRLLIIYNTVRFQLLAHEELTVHLAQGAPRAPLVAHLYDRLWGRELLLMVNNLYHSGENVRWWQARHLNSWARQQTLPVVAVGDYNFAWDVANGDRDHDPGYDYLVAAGAWKWVRPAILAPTQCHGSPCANNHIVDFIFVAQDALGWTGMSTIVVTPGDFPETSQTSDHRPVRAEFWLP
jgi:endonuclease/exonuclease/phosphatase family metal-dependent hydrolase